MEGISIPIRRVDEVVGEGEVLSLITFPCTDSGAPVWIERHHHHPLVDMFITAIEKTVKKHGVILQGRADAVAVFWTLPSTFSDLVVRTMLPHPRGVSFDLCGIAPRPREIASPFNVDGMSRCGFSLRVSGLNSCEFDAVAGIVEIEAFVRRLRRARYPTDAIEHLEEITWVSPNRNQRAAQDR